MANIRRFGWVPDHPDPRDLTFKSIWHPRRKIPEMVDLEPQCSPVEDQGQIGSCVANAAVGLLEFLELKLKTDAKMVDLSRLMVYYNARDLEGTADQDSGCMIRDAIKTLAKFGTCHESTWAYDTAYYNVKPPEQAYVEGQKHLVSEYRRVNTGNELLSCLAEGFPVEFGVVLYDSFMTDKVAKTGIVPLPNPHSENQVGGHAMCIVGYNLKGKGTYKVRNSWGPGWGKGGYCTVPMKWLDTSAVDLWTIRTLG